MISSSVKEEQDEEAALLKKQENKLKRMKKYEDMSEDEIERIERKREKKMQQRI
eukprot:CAMPEP_0202973548 /NCGR_PEP_ID=MMETSP1396-20130829/51224_1 /ASSEMBLY_ACC=CAM_ASM_000872 /TAXON_ID= /ORGANISM="Pseudokeronopsis sp., Strain Brazil" /LENGTH=53 /DNA_ID=CAMNT_0049705797 /DNA_START=79 /DNA_END=240 /DNA_ORIENTATION=+